MTLAILSALGGGILIGGAAVFMKAATGHIPGVSGIMGRAISSPPALWCWAFLAGIVGSGVMARFVWGWSVPVSFSQSGWPLLMLSGVLVGVGTRLARGCTSGHGVCGLGNLSGRSLIAVLCFMVTAGLVVFARHYTG